MMDNMKRNNIHIIGIPEGEEEELKRMAKNIPNNENQRPTTKATLPSKALNQDVRPNKEFPRQKKSKRIYLHQTSSAKMLKGLL